MGLAFFAFANFDKAVRGTEWEEILFWILLEIVADHVAPYVNHLLIIEAVHLAVALCAELFMVALPIDQCQIFFRKFA